MPELPEVETIIRTLETNLLHQRVDSVALFYARLLEDGSLPIGTLVGRKFTEFTRRGKYLVFGLEGYYWVVHLRMEGKFHLYDTVTPLEKHAHLRMQTNSTDIHYLDTRKFSRMAITTDLDSYFENKNLGLEPFDSKLKGQHLFDIFERTQRNMKVCLLDQSIVVGIGNIYADEILFREKIHPLRVARSLSLSECERLVESIRFVLNKAIDEGGTTIRSYTSSLGVNGRFQVSLKAYGKEGLECERCGTVMQRIKVAGRSSVFCPSCQKEFV